MNIPEPVMNAISKLSPERQEQLFSTMTKYMTRPMAMPLSMVQFALILAYVPHWVRVGVIFYHTKRYDNRNPRTMSDRFPELDDKTRGLGGVLQRLSAAHANGLETFAPFAVGVLGMSPRTLNIIY